MLSVATVQGIAHFQHLASGASAAANRQCLWSNNNQLVIMQSFAKHQERGVPPACAGCAPAATRATCQISCCADRMLLGITCTPTATAHPVCATLGQPGCRPVESTCYLALYVQTLVSELTLTHKYTPHDRPPVSAHCKSLLCDAFLCVASAYSTTQYMIFSVKRTASSATQPG